MLGESQFFLKNPSQSQSLGSIESDWDFVLGLGLGVLKRSRKSTFNYYGLLIEQPTFIQCKLDQDIFRCSHNQDFYLFIKCWNAI